jgi:hypothetical protein
VSALVSVAVSEGTVIADAIESIGLRVQLRG